MTSLSIGPREIYVHHFDEDMESTRFIREDSEASVVQFRKWEHLHKNKEFLNGYDFQKNILMLAAYYANVNLVKFIVEHADKKILDCRDDEGETALFYAAMSKGTLEKSMRCVKLLIAAGANMNLREGAILWPASIKDELDEKQFGGSNVLGQLVEIVANKGYRSEEEEQNFKKLIQLFVEHGASCYIENVGEITENENPETAVYSDVLNEAKAQAMWAKARFVYLANRSPDSSVSSFPQDMVNLIIQKIHTL